MVRACVLLNAEKLVPIPCTQLQPREDGTGSQQQASCFGLYGWLADIGEAFNVIKNVRSKPRRGKERATKALATSQPWPRRAQGQHPQHSKPLPEPLIDGSLAGEHSSKRHASCRSDQRSVLSLMGLGPLDLSLPACALHLLRQLSSASRHIPRRPAPAVPSHVGGVEHRAGPGQQHRQGGLRVWLPQR